MLRAVGWWTDDGPSDTAADVLGALARTPDPDLALHSVDRLRTVDEESWQEINDTLRTNTAFRARLLGVLGYSTVLGDLLASRPGQWRRLVPASLTATRDYESRLAEAVSSEGDVLTGPTAVRSLRMAYRELLLEIAAEDLAHVVESELPRPSLTDVTRALTELAEAALRAGLLIAQREVGHSADGTLAIIAMGKCGARELNYVSDVDVVFVGGDDIPVATRLATALMRIVGQSCFELDAALRPEGKAGALVRSLDSYESYYTRWARTWEFQALLRRGGLRDVEFAVQLLQLVHGRVDTTLRSPSTVDALEALGVGGYVGRVDAAELRESYEFLRTVEHRLQLRGLRRTHLFPEQDDVERLRWLARACAIRPAKGKPENEILTSEFRRHVRRIRRLHEKLFYRPLLEAVSKVPTEALRLTTEQAASRLALTHPMPTEGCWRIGAYPKRWPTPPGTCECSETRPRSWNASPRYSACRDWCRTFW